MEKYQISWSIDRVVDLAVINQVENMWGISFPKKYVEIVKKHDGSCAEFQISDDKWVDGCIDIHKWAGKTTGFDFLKFPNNNNNIKKSTIYIVYESFKKVLPNQYKIFPFGGDGGGNLFLFDYRKNENNPSIVFLDHEELITEDDLDSGDLKEKPVAEWLEDNLFYVSDSFEAFIEAIYPDEDE